MDKRSQDMHILQKRDKKANDEEEMRKSVIHAETNVPWNVEEPKNNNNPKIKSAEKCLHRS